jgi:uncharacterized protein YecT (DUF1311 family)
MRIGVSGPAVLLVVGLAVAGCSSSSSDGASPSSTSVATSVAATPTALPAVPEAFTLLPCPKGTRESTIAIEGCTEHKIVRLDKQVMATARAVLGTMSTAAGRRDLVAAQRTWITYRKAVCTSEADVYSGGTLAPVAYANCEVRLDKARIADLRAMQGDRNP